ECLIRSHVAQGRLRDALRHAESALKLPKAPLSLRKSATALLNLAQRGTELAREVKPPRGKAEAALRAIEAYVCAEYLHREGRPVADVRKLLDVAFAQDVPVGPAFALRGLLALDKGRIREALADGDRAATLSPLHADGFYVRGRARLERGDYGALGDLLRA